MQWEITGFYLNQRFKQDADKSYSRSFIQTRSSPPKSVSSLQTPLPKGSCALLSVTLSMPSNTSKKM